MVRIYVLATLIALTLGCSGQDDQKPKGTVFDPQIQAVKKAKSVDKTIDDAAAKQRQAIEEQGG